MGKEVTQEDRRYQLPLPFRKKDQHWPNNRVHVKMRLQGSKKRFIEDLLREGYAKSSPNPLMVTNGTSHIMAYPTQLNQEK